MTAPRWIAEAIEAVTSTIRGGEVFPGIPMIDAHRLPTALIERLPLEALRGAVQIKAADAQAVYDAGPKMWWGDETFAPPPRVIAEIVGRVVCVLTDGDPEVIELVEIYQGACRALDAAGVPYATGGDDGQIPVRLNLAGRIQWLAQQRPTRLDLQRVEAERDDLQRLLSLGKQAVAAEHALAEQVASERNAARTEAHTLGEFIRSAHDELTAAGVAQSPTDPQHMLDSALVRRVRSLRDERDQLQKMYEGASEDLDRERTAHQEAEAAVSNREIALAVDLDNARETIALRDAEAVKQMADRDEERRLRDQTLRALVESDKPAHEIRLALAELIGMGAQARVFAATDRQVLRAKVADQAAYIEQLECEIDALEDEIWQGEP